MLTVLIDYESGNLHSAEKAFERMARETGAGEVLVSARAEDVARADRIVLPGAGAFPACMAALEGSGVTMDRKANAAFYGSADMTPEKVFASSPNVAPNIANDFVQLLTRQTSRLPKQPGMQAGTEAGQPTEVEPEQPRESKVRTFGIPDPDEEL